jgi:hypothetical protein
VNDEEARRTRRGPLFHSWFSLFGLASRLIGYYGDQGAKDTIEFAFNYQKTFKSVEFVQRG